MIARTKWGAILRTFGFTFVVGALVAPVRADVRLAPLFRDGAVLQRDQPLPVWGRAGAGERVVVELGGERGEARADENGRWRVTLAPRSASSRAVELTVTASNRLTVRNILIGEVWLCSGQSNMQMTIDHTRGAKGAEASGAGAEIRQFRVANQFASEAQDDVAGDWQTCTPEALGGFSAVGRFFAQSLASELRVPIGIILSAYGNTPIGSWRNADAVSAEPAVRYWWAQQQRGNPPPRPHRAPASCYNGMIHPLVPFALRGVLWYQGESDATEAATLAPVYARQFSALIQEWRRDFAAGDLPFFWVQLAGYGDAGNRAWVETRAAQASALALPHTGMAVATDVGAAHDIHPLNKKPVGERLARLALRRVYQRTVVDTGPEPTSAAAEPGEVRVTFTRADGELRAEGELAAAFEVAGTDGRFVPASGVTISGDTVVLRTTVGMTARRVRFAWHNLPAGTLRNGAGLPAAPFVREISGP